MLTTGMLTNIIDVKCAGSNHHKALTFCGLVLDHKLQDLSNDLYVVATFMNHLTSGSIKDSAFKIK